MALGGLLGAWMEIANQRTQNQINLLQNAMTNPNLTDAQRQAMAAQMQTIFDKSPFFSPYHGIHLPTTPAMGPGNANAPAGGVGADVSGAHINVPASGGAFGTVGGPPPGPPAAGAAQPITSGTPMISAPAPGTSVVPSVATSTPGTPGFVPPSTPAPQSATSALSKTMPGVNFQGQPQPTTQYVLPPVSMSDQTFAQLFKQRPDLIRALQEAGFPIDQPVSQVNSVFGGGWRAVIYNAGGGPIPGGTDTGPDTSAGGGGAAQPTGPSGQPGDTRTPYPWLSGTPAPAGSPAPGAGTTPPGSVGPRTTGTAATTPTSLPPARPGTFGATAYWLANVASDPNNPRAAQLAAALWNERIPYQLLDANGFPDYTKIDAFLKANGLQAPAPMSPYEARRLADEEATAHRGEYNTYLSGVRTNVQRLVGQADSILGRRYVTQDAANAAQKQAHNLYLKVQGYVQREEDAGRLTQQDGDALLATLPTSYAPSVQPPRSLRLSVGGGRTGRGGRPGTKPPQDPYQGIAADALANGGKPSKTGLANFTRAMQAQHWTMQQTRDWLTKNYPGWNTPTPSGRGHAAGGTATPTGPKNPKLPAAAVYAGQDSRTHHDVYRAPDGTMYDNSTGQVLR